MGADNTNAMIACTSQTIIKAKSISINMSVLLTTKSHGLKYFRAFPKGSAAENTTP